MNKIIVGILIAIFLLVGFLTVKSVGGDELSFGYVGDSPTYLTDKRAGTLVPHTNVFISDDLEVGSTAYITTSSVTDGWVGGFTQGNGTLASTTSGGVGTLTEADLLDNSILDILSTVDTSFALTLPATSTMTTLLPNAGDMRSWWIQNASTTAAVAITITKGAGIDLVGVDANVDIIDGAEWAEMNCYRKVDTDVVCKLNELVHAD